MSTLDQCYFLFVNDLAQWHTKYGNQSSRIHNVIALSQQTESVNMCQYLVSRTFMQNVIKTHAQAALWQD